MLTAQVSPGPSYARTLPVDPGWFDRRPCRIDRDSGLPTCPIIRPHTCFREWNRSRPWWELGASIATHARYRLTGDAPGRYVGPWLTEAQARTYAREAERVDPGELRELFPGLYIEEHGSSVRVLHLDGAILLEWDEGAVVETYAEDAPVRVQEWPDSAI